MLIDCFLYSDEKDILQLRLEELESVVDAFILVEHNRTFSGKEKPFYAEKLGTAFHPKLYVYSYDRSNPDPDPWVEEKIQRNNLRNALDRCAVEEGLGSLEQDVIIIGDVDEIPRREVMEEAKHHGVPHAYYMVLDTAYYKLNMRSNKGNDWPSVILSPYKNLWPCLDSMRRNRFGGPHVYNAGWHFSYVMTTEKIIDKLSAFSHREYNCAPYNTPEWINNAIAQGADLFGRGETYHKETNPEEFPHPVQENPEKWKHLMI